MTDVPDAVAMEDVACPICDTGTSRFVLEGRDRIHNLPGTFTIVECESCGLKRTTPRPTAESIGAYYPDDYGPYVGTQIGAGERSGGWRSRLIKLGRAIFNVRAHAVPAQDPGDMLEIGCASGNYLHAMAQAGWRVEGVEFSDSAASSARALGYPVQTGAIESIDKPPASYDLIVGWMVLEHLHQPLLALRKMRQWIRPDGHLVLSVPDAGAREFSIFSSRWYALHLPNHLFHFDSRSITQLLTTAGWKVTRIQSHRTVANAIASLGYVLQDRGFTRLGSILASFPETSGRLGALALFPIATLAAAAGQTGRMTVWAKPA